MKIELLDHGYVELIEPWGRGKSGRKNGLNNPIRPDEVFMPFDDYEVAIIEAARQSTQGSFRGWEQDSKLLERLYDKRHSTPFEFSGMTIEVQAPIVVFREWHRHRTQSYNEMSARYAALPDLYYVPEQAPTERRFLSAATTKNKQEAAVVQVALDTVNVVEVTRDWIDSLSKFYTLAETFYKDSLGRGIPKELARLSMPVGHYSRMRATGNLRNWLAFLTLRMDPDAQWEIRQFANAIGDHFISKTFPQTWKLFNGSRG